MTAVVTTAQPGTASVLLEVTDAPSPGGAVYTGTFESAGVDSWTTSNGLGSVSRLAAAARSGGFGLRTQLVDGGRAQRVITGLSVGVVYRADVYVRQTGGIATGISLDIEGGASTSSEVPPSTWRLLRLDFTATATSHTLRVRGSNDVDDVSVAPLPGQLTPLTITRVDVNGARPVRLLEDQQPNAGVLTAVDYEPALRGSIEYRVVDGLGAIVTATTSLDGLVTRPWLTVPVLPQLGRQVDVLLDDYAGGREPRGRLHNVIDRVDPVPHLAPLSLRAGSWSVLVTDHATAREVEAVFDRGQIVMVRQATHDGLDAYVVPGRVSTRPDGPRWRVTFDFAEVAPPSGPLQGGLGWDFTAVAAGWADFNGVKFSGYPDFASLAAGPT